jgi:predicted AlkP superfamily pyrophosphatase or phosphodiesterase
MNQFFSSFDSSHPCSDSCFSFFKNLKGFTFRFLFYFSVIFLIPFLSQGFNQKKPRLVVVLVVDQMRADIPIKFSQDLLPGGFKKILSEGAYAPFASYPVLQNMTCPGHAMIATGSTPSRNKIPLNEWFPSSPDSSSPSSSSPSPFSSFLPSYSPLQNSKSSQQLQSCAFDSEFGASPRNLLGSTIGDELRLRYPKSKVVSLALKTRSSVMLGGHSATAAYWFDEGENRWVTSPYYKHVLPSLKTWTHPRNPTVGQNLVFEPELLKKKASFQHKVIWGESKSLTHPVALEQTFAFAKTIINQYDLGQGSNTDLLLISLSNHDIVGHQFGPDSPETHETTLREDREIAQFFSFLKKEIPGGLNSVWVTLTADHGVAPLVETAQNLGLSAGRIDFKSKIKDWNELLNQKISYCPSHWIVASKSFHLYLNSECMKKNSDKISTLFSFLIEQIHGTEGMETAVVCDRYQKNSHFIPEEIKQKILVSCVPGVSGQIIAVPKPFWYEQGPATTHMTPYSYDRYVPLAFWGQPFKKGVIEKDVSILDLSGTLLYGLGLLPTAQFEGKIQYDIFKKTQPFPHESLPSPPAQR